MAHNYKLDLLINRGDRVELANGRLVITPSSGRPVPPDWLSNHQSEIITRMLALVGIDAFRYDHYSTGNYSKHLRPGLTLQLTSILSECSVYTIFNVGLKRTRNNKHGKKGDPLPEGQFLPGWKSDFIQFWKRCDLPQPARRGSFHDYMGKLKPLILTGEFSKTPRLISGSIKPLSISYEHLVATIHTDNYQTPTGQSPDNCQTNLPYKKTPQALLSQGLQPNFATGEKSHGIRQSGNKEAREEVLPFKPPQLQSANEWLADYDNNQKETNFANDFG